MPGKDFHERAEIRQAHDLAEVGLADFGGGGDVADHLQRRFGRSAVGGEDVHFAVVHDVDLDAGGFDDGANLLAAGTDQVANLVGGNGEHEQARRVLRHRPRDAR